MLPPCRDLRAEREKAKITVKVKKEEEESQKTLKGMQDTLEAIRVLMAEDRKPRKVAQPFRTNVWCTRCGLPGHFATDCSVYRRVTGRNVHPVQYVNQEDGCYYTFPDEEPEEEEQPVYQVQTVCTGEVSRSKILWSVLVRFLGLPLDLRIRGCTLLPDSKIGK